MIWESLREEKLALVWLTREEQRDPAVLAQLDLLYADAAKSKTKVALLQSGEGELLAHTKELLANQSAPASAPS